MRYGASGDYNRRCVVSRVTRVAELGDVSSGETDSQRFGDRERGGRGLTTNRGEQNRRKTIGTTTNYVREPIRLTIVGEDTSRAKLIRGRCYKM